MEDMLQQFSEVKLVLNSKKCKFFQQEVNLLGYHVLVKDEITPQAEKLDKIEQFPVPENQTEVRGFLNLCGFYRQHIRCFSEIANPLSLLLKKIRRVLLSSKLSESL
ncbi:hypothetical protein [Parasitella parasitica]|uniref:Reverse transcriptase domain-containing protein n=1 Tax=Parasitella parasitica TaxID=35722 RepID=A0A0B7MW17_9FUNG|nr:hypothetical protein [Parasitella parasitica]